uniref:Neur_chan_LBD domain-containing protein n=1 Tax=Hymenolepis diminuta TaxID=6216 RepID=A0A0R3SC66_HYMDI
LFKIISLSLHNRVILRTYCWVSEYDLSYGNPLQIMRAYSESGMRYRIGKVWPVNEKD